MTLGSLLSLFGFSLLIAKVALTASVSNISLKTLQAYTLVFVARLSSILFYEGYLPFDRSGDWFYQAAEVIGLIMTILLIVALTYLHPRKYSRTLDHFTAPGVPEFAGVVVLIVPAAVLAVVFHPSLNNNWLTDTAWAFALYLEAIAIYPQLHMFYSQPTAGDAATPEPEVFEVNFVFALAVGRLCHFVFWLSSYQELNDRASNLVGKKFPGHLVVMSQVRCCAEPVCCHIWLLALYI